MDPLTNEMKDDLISNFCNITGVEPDRGQFYLESTNWDIQLAIQSFFEHSAEDTAMDTNPNPNPNPNPIANPNLTEEQQSAQQMAQQLQQMFGNRSVADNLSDSESSPTSQGMSSPKSSQKQPKSESKPKTSSKFATLDSLKRQNDSGGSSGEDEGQAFYAGGSERSGQQVLGPKKKNTDEFVSKMFAAAKEHGAEVVDQNESTKPKKSLNTFGGTGFKLGSNTVGSTPVATTSSAQRPRNRETVLKLWRNGFSVDNGPLRDYNDPQNQDFLASIYKGEIPRELQSVGQEVHLNMEDHKTEEFIATKGRREAFTGEGHRLGNPSADVVTTTVQSNTDPKVSETEALNRLNVNPTLPTTSIQIRLSDGTRLVVKLNLTHTIANIRQFICNSRPIYSAQSFILMTTFPNKELTDESLTIKDANLSNASIVQRLK